MNEPASSLSRSAISISNRLEHRGPESRGEWKDTHVALAHRRLAILDLSSSGNQPIQSRSGRWTLVLNGEIFNFVELRSEIGGEWRGSGDAETLVEALDRWELKALPRLAGMFAFAAWDGLEQRLLLVRDPLGLKPLFYYEEPDGSLLFSSTATSLASERQSRLDSKALACVLSLGYPPVGHTLFKEVKELPPAHFAIWDGKKTSKPLLKPERYWFLPHPESKYSFNEDEIDESFGDIFHKVLRQWARSDVPSSILLSSGVDSTTVATGLAMQGIDVTALTVKMPHPELDESSLASRRAKDLSLTCKVLEIENIDPLNVIDTIVLHSDLPTVDSSQVGTWFLCQQAASLGKVVFTGDGADELFGGYPTHTANALLDSRMGQILRKLSEISAGLASRAPYGEGSPGWRHKITRILRYAQYGLPEAAFRWRTLVDQSLFPELFDDLAFDPWPMFMSSDYDYAQFSPLDRCLALEVELMLPQGEVARLDRMSMAHSLEARPPFLDHRIAEFAFRLPFHAKWSWLAGGKRPIVRWLRKTLPTWTRQPKKGFNHPVQNWFMGPLGELLLDEASCNGAALSIRFNKLEEMLRDHRLRRYDYSFELWTLLFLLIWIRVHRVSL